MPANRKRDEKIPWWVYMGFMDEYSVMWMYDFYDLYREEESSEEADEAFNGEQTDRRPSLPGGAGADQPAAFAGFTHAIARIASRFHRRAAEGAASTGNGQGDLVLPGSRP